MSLRLRSGIPVVLDRLAKSNTHHSQIYRINSRNISFVNNLKRWLQRPETVSSSIITRFALSSRPPPPKVESIETLSEYDEIILTQNGCSREVKLTTDGQQNTRVEYGYEVTDKQGNKLFTASQMYETCPPKFDLKLFGPDGQVLVVHKLFQSLSNRLLSMQIMCPGGGYIGSIEEKSLVDCEDPNAPLFELKDNMDVVKAIVQTDFASSGFGLRRTIKILTPDHQKTIGTISKRWGGFSDNLVVNFDLSKDVDGKCRAELIGLCILMSHRYIR